MLHEATVRPIGERAAESAARTRSSVEITDFIARSALVRHEEARRRRNCASTKLRAEASCANPDGRIMDGKKTFDGKYRRIGEEFDANRP